jgi:hypothetical protein
VVIDRPESAAGITIEQMGGPCNSKLQLTASDGWIGTPRRPRTNVTAADSVVACQVNSLMRPGSSSIAAKVRSASCNRSAGVRAA